jgi:hypothetical protein
MGISSGRVWLTANVGHNFSVTPTHKEGVREETSITGFTVRRYSGHPRGSHPPQEARQQTRNGKDKVAENPMIL